MKRSHCLQLLPLLCGLGSLISGCLLKPAPVPTHYFLLAPMQAPAVAPAPAQPLSVEVESVKMPAYLLRDSLAVRQSATEIHYLEAALWAERLDQSFRRTVAENLSLLLASDRVDGSSSQGNRVRVRVSVNVEQFDVDTQGRGRLLAGWRLTVADTDKPIKDGQTRLTRPGPALRGNPQAIATTLSALTAEFSQDLARALRESAQARQ